MKLIDDKFLQAPGRFVAQSLLAFVVIAAIVVGLGVVTEGVVVAALGASAFIVFAMPKHDTAGVRNLVGGHAVCIAIGLLCSLPLRFGWWGGSDVEVGLLAAAAVSLAIFGMVVLDAEHPPAAGNALAFTVFRVSYDHILFIGGAILFLAVVHYVLRDYLQDLT